MKAVVLGAGIAGLLAARVLADHCTEVVLVERDSLDAGWRRGVPQGRHLHGLLDRGRAVLEELFPGFTGEAAARGATTAEALVGTRWYLGGSRLAATPTGLTSVMATRPLLEAIVRERVLALPGVRLHTGTVRGLVGDAGAVRGVRVAGDGQSTVRYPATAAGPDGAPVPARSRGTTDPGTTDPGTTDSGTTDSGTTDSGTTDSGTADPGTADPGTADPAVGVIELPADLVVDATGRGSRAPQWLADLGFPAPAEERLEVDLGYASALFPRTEGQLDNQSSVIISTGPDGRGGGAIRVQGDRWHVTLAGMLGDHPPTDPAGFTAFAATLAAPDIHDLVDGIEPLGEITPHRFRSPLRRRYERLRTVPAGFLVLGDALCSFNPLYAQGMAVAAQQALVLRDCLAADPAVAGDDAARAATGPACRVPGVQDPDLPARFYAAASAVVDVAWRLSAGSDLANPGVRGTRTVRTRLTNAYVARAHRAAHADPLVARAFLRVGNLVDPPAALLRPTLARRILLPSSANGASEPTG
ncbi:FAD-dependent oxidoreductase [Nocardia sp. NPDC057227]|uniref:FAD-dependent oxidoreductase n=1 Tax=Nocardia sp. NPDC057227 TaxID=3346056 RepID=UPI0036304A19